MKADRSTAAGTLDTPQSGGRRVSGDGAGDSDGAGGGDGAGGSDGAGGGDRAGDSRAGEGQQGWGPGAGGRATDILGAQQSGPAPASHGLWAGLGPGWASVQGSPEQSFG